MSVDHVKSARKIKPKCINVTRENSTIGVECRKKLKKEQKRKKKRNKNRDDSPRCANEIKAKQNI